MMNRNTMRSAMQWGVITLLMAAAALPASAQGRRDDRRDYRIDTTFAFDRRGTVVLDAGGGDIIVTAWDQPRIRVQAAADRSDIRLEASATRVSLDLSRSRGNDVRYELTVPVGVRVNARATTGDIHIRGTRGIVEANTQSGDLTVEDAAEIVDLRTYSGDLTARNLAGNVEVNTLSGELAIDGIRGDVEVMSVSGDLDLRNVVARYVRARTTSGDVTFDGVIDSTGRYELGSHSGSVEIIVPENTGALLTVATYTGTIDSDFPITLKPGEHALGGTRRFTLEIGSGAGRISAESFSGDITIRSRASVNR